MRDARSERPSNRKLHCRSEYQCPYLGQQM